MTQIQVQILLLGAHKAKDCGEHGNCTESIVTEMREGHDRPGKERFTAINSCLCPVGSVDGASIITVEGIGNSKAGYHAVQGMQENPYIFLYIYIHMGSVRMQMGVFGRHARSRSAKCQGVECGCRAPGHVLGFNGHLLLDAASSFASAHLHSRGSLLGE